MLTIYVLNSCAPTRSEFHGFNNTLRKEMLSNICTAVVFKEYHINLKMNFNFNFNSSNFGQHLK